MLPTSANCKRLLRFCIVSRHSTNYPIELQFCSCCWRVISTRVVPLKRYFSHGFSCSCHRPFCCLSNVRNEWNKCFCSMSLGRECNSTNCKNNTVTFYFNITEAWSGLKHSKLWAISTVTLVWKRNSALKKFPVGLSWAFCRHQYWLQNEPKNEDFSWGHQEKIALFRNPSKIT